MKPSSRSLASTEIKELLTSLVGNLPIGIIALDLNYRCILANTRAGNVFGVTPEKLVDISFQQILDVWPALKEQVSAGDYSKKIEFDVYAICLNKRIFDVRCRSIINGMLLTLHDITAESKIRQRQSELVKRLENANRELAEFAYICAHDMKSPVSSIVGLIEMMAENEEDKDEFSEVLPMLAGAADNLHKKIRSLNEILTFKQTLSSVKGESSVSGVLADVKSSLSLEIKAADAAVEVTDEAHLTLPIAEAHLHSILHNLISNAIKYRHSDRQAKVSVCMMRNPQAAVLSVADNGIGFDSTVFKDKPFGLFNRLHTHVEGDGVGLYLVKSIVDSYGGNISVNSTKEKGSTFKVEFPNVL